jgi:hypothetical protein
VIPHPPNFVDFFAGSGLVTQGVRHACVPVWSNDICPKKAAVYTANHGDDHFHLGSIEHVLGKEIPKGDIVWASFPCQDLSLAGKMGGLAAARSGLFWEWLRVLDEIPEKPAVIALENESVSKRLITGIAAERYFAAVFPTLDEFVGHKLRNVTRFGCGFDFRIQPRDSDRFLVAEVKGLAGSTGEIMMTPKEHRVAEYLGERYFLCVIRNFSERPTLSIFRNPLEHGLEFVRRERRQTIETWHARISA